MFFFIIYCSVADHNITYNLIQKSKNLDCNFWTKITILQ